LVQIARLGLQKEQHRHYQRSLASKNGDVTLQEARGLKMYYIDKVEVVQELQEKLINATE
jgi:hypothetical protein